MAGEVRDDSATEIEVGAQDEGAGDAAVAFEALRQTVERRGLEIGAEMTVIRKGVEAAFDRFDRIAVPPDYGADFGRIVQQLGTMTERLAGIERLPVLRQGAEHYARTIERSGADLMRSAVREFERKASGLDETQKQLAGYMQSARDAQAQRRQVGLTLFLGVMAGLVLGVAAVLSLPRFLPAWFGVTVATTAMGEANLWSAGAILSIPPVRDADLTVSTGRP